MSYQSSRESCSHRITFSSDSEMTRISNASGKFLQRQFSISQEKKAPKTSTVSYTQLFRFATWQQRALLTIGGVCSVFGSSAIPLLIILYSEYTTLLVDRVKEVGRSTQTTFLNVFGGGRTLVDASTEENRAAIWEDAIAYGYGTAVVILILFCFTSVAVILVNYVALKQVNTIRKLFFKSALRQEIGWYDVNSDESFAVRIVEDMEKIREGIGEKLVMFIYQISTFTFCFGIAFWYGWELTLVILSGSPLIIASTVFVSKAQARLSQKELKSYSSAGTIVEEVLGAIRTVYAYSGQEKEIDRFQRRLIHAEKNGIKKGFFTGLGGGFLWLIVYSVYGVGFWYGMHLIIGDRDMEVPNYTAAVLFVCMFGVMSGSESLGQTLPYFETFNTSRGAAESIFSLIERSSRIDPLGTDGWKPKSLKGEIEFRNVKFAYPARSEVTVLSGLNLKIEAGQTVALVGPSGCGKSTCVQLVQRFYDPQEGFVALDGVKLSQTNPSVLRSFIGFVGQEPVLFDTTIMENIRYGKEDATMEEIVRAAQTANCHEFISKLPQGYHTRVGEKGSQFSGGQKQRIAIARAIIRNPSILLLDEATSALDLSSERKVQAALDKVSKGRTTIIVSHRLSTIVNADRIVYVDRGVVVEDGSHEELMKLEGKYWELAMAQSDKKVHGMRSDLKTRIEDEEVSDSEGEEELPSKDDSDKDEKPREKEKYPAPFMRLLKLNSPEGGYLFLGFLAASIVGASFPVFGVLFGSVYGLIANDDIPYVEKMSNIYAILFACLGVVAGLAMFFQTYSLNVAGARLTKRLRVLTFSSMLRQEISWYDEPHNAVGNLSGRLSSDCADVQMALGTRIGYIFQAISIIVIGIGIALYYSWQLTVVGIWAMPLSLGVVILEAYYTSKSGVNEKLAMEGASKIAVDTITNIRTIASLGQERHVIARYDKTIDQATRHCEQKIRFRGPIFALTQVVPILGYSVTMVYGGWLVSRFQTDYDNLVKVSEALLFGLWMLGQALIYAPNVNSAITSAGRILHLMDREPKILDPKPDPWTKDWKSQGSASYQEVRFRYPSRPKALVLDGLNLDVPRGKTVALVGPSGSGKSTTVQLLLRYYDFEGTIKLDDHSTHQLPIETIRGELGIVSQEPVLFDRTIADNIAYGDNKRGHSISMAEIIEAAKQANIHEFIMGLPLGYETPLGTKASKLSGGQKQRIAIARALLRNPKILLLDEATSALDNQSEKVVQAALEDAARGRTCITIAHRLTTIRNADLICVLENGKLIESGTHEALMAQKGSYARLYEMQQIT